MKLIFAIIPLSVGLVSCGAVRARDDAFQARDQYAACLKQNAAEPASCDSLWQTYQINRQHYLDVMESN
jgi:hypothetical protein